MWLRSSITVDPDADERINMFFTTDFHHFSALLANLYTPREIVDFPAHALSLLAKLIDPDPTAYRQPDVDGTSTFSLPQRLHDPIAHSSKPFASPTDSSSDESIDRFPLFKQYLRQHQDTATKITDFSIESDLHRVKGAYWRFLKPIEIEDRSGKIFTDPLCAKTTHAIYFLKADAICLTVRRNLLTMTERDRWLLDSIRPHLLQAYHNSIAFTEINARRARPDCSCGERGNAGTVELSTDASIRALGLTKREFEVLCWLAKDKSNSEIARLLKCSLSTVKKHLEHIYEKLEVQTRTAAVMRLLSQSGSIDL
jgi:DNA-binding CsgD family transcriptional regulator